MTRVLRCGPLIGVLMLGLACGTDRPTAPSALPDRQTTTQPPPPPTPPPPPPSPPTPPPAPPQPSGEPVGVYVFSGPLDYPIRGFTAGSQYLLYDNGVFGLRYDAFPNVGLGTYRQDDGTITFRFDERGPGTKGGAAGVIPAPRVAYARSRRGPSRATCWRSATATACSTRTSRTPSTGDSSSPLSHDGRCHDSARDWRWVAIGSGGVARRLLRCRWRSRFVGLSTGAVALSRAGHASRAPVPIPTRQ